MRLPRVRFTVRRLMAVVAVVGVLFGAVIGVERRRVRFERLAVAYAEEGRFQQLCQLTFRVRLHPAPSPSEWRTVNAHDGLSLYYSELATRYRQAAKRPWLPVGPDPPVPAWPEGVPRAPYYWERRGRRESPPGGAGRALDRSRRAAYPGARSDPLSSRRVTPNALDRGHPP